MKIIKIINHYFQVALTVRDENVLERELKSLQKTGDYYPKYLITMDMDLSADYNGITKINVVDWLLEKNIATEVIGYTGHCTACQAMIKNE